MSVSYFLNRIKNDFQVCEPTPHFRRDFDTPWKTVLQFYFKDCLDFFFSDIAGEIDWHVPVEFLDCELRKIALESETGRRIVDVLARVHLKKGSDVAFLLHVEVQGAEVKKFSERIFIYYSRIFDRHRLPVITLALLTDDNPQWRPQVYEFNIFGFEHRLKFPIVKLLDYQNQRTSLEQSENPFALVVLAQLEAIRTKKNYTAGLQAKIALTRHLYTLGKARGKSTEFIRHLFNTIDFLLALPPSRAVEYREALHIIEQEVDMAYVSSIEKLALQQGFEKGIEKGIEQGIVKGIEKGVHQGKMQEQQKIMHRLRAMGMSSKNIEALVA